MTRGRVVNNETQWWQSAREMVVECHNIAVDNRMVVTVKVALTSWSMTSEPLNTLLLGYVNTSYLVNPNLHNGKTFTVHLPILQRVNDDYKSNSCRIWATKSLIHS
jgi:hypothetical protein